MKHGCLIVLMCVVVPAVAEPLAGKRVVVESDFKSKTARNEISGAACGGQRGRTDWCLAVNDEKRYAQFFKIVKGRIVPHDAVGVLPKRLGETKMSEIDAEGAAYGDGYMYVVGSHGLSRSSGGFRPSQFFIFRMPVRRSNGRPRFRFTREIVSPKVQRSGKLRPLIARARHIGSFAEKPLDKNGANIEAIAVRQGRIFLGFRGPSVGGKGFVMEVRASTVFGRGKRKSKVHSLALGKDTGIRDMATVKGGILLLTGPVNHQDVARSVFFWRPRTGALKKLAELGQDHYGLAETLLVLSEKKMKRGTRYRVIVMYDGLRNGWPTLFEIERKLRRAKRTRGRQG